MSLMAAKCDVLNHHKSTRAPSRDVTCAMGRREDGMMLMSRRAGKGAFISNSKNNYLSSGLIKQGNSNKALCELGCMFFATLTVLFHGLML